MDERISAPGSWRSSTRPRSRERPRSTESAASQRPPEPKLLLVGDPYQLQSVEAGGAFAILVDRHTDAPELTDIQRFVNEARRPATSRWADPGTPRQIPMHPTGRDPQCPRCRLGRIPDCSRCQISSSNADDNLR